MISPDAPVPLGDPLGRERLFALRQEPLELPDLDGPVVVGTDPLALQFLRADAPRDVGQGVAGLQQGQRLGEAPVAEQVQQ